jgi:hypothetical protein
LVCMERRGGVIATSDGAFTREERALGDYSAISVCAFIHDEKGPASGSAGRLAALTGHD